MNGLLSFCLSLRSNFGFNFSINVDLSSKLGVRLCFMTESECHNLLDYNDVTITLRVKIQ